MQPVPPQDRQKVMAVVVGIIIALFSLARSGMGTPCAPAAGTRAQSREPDAEATSTVAPSADLLPAGTPAGVARTASAGETTAGGAGLAIPAGRRLHDPFRPIPASLTALAPPAPAAPVQRQMAPAPRADRIAPVLAPLVSASASARGRGHNLEPAAGASAAPRALLSSGMSNARPSQPADQRPPERVAAPLALIGTVGSGDAAVATFRLGTETVFAGPQEMVGGWQVARIGVGRVWLARDHVRRLVRAGNSLPDQSFRK